MKTFTGLFVLVLIVLTYSCNQRTPIDPETANNAQDSLVYNPFDSLHLKRKVFAGIDSLELNPFEIYLELELVDVEIGMFNSLVFNTEYEELKELTLNSEEIIFDDKLLTAGVKSLKRVDIMLPLSMGKPLKREVLFTNKYHAILYHDVDEVAYRDREGMCNYSTYKIIDIVPVGQSFYRDTRR
jgi:hypothetical protein